MKSHREKEKREDPLRMKIKVKHEKEREQRRTNEKYGRLGSRSKLPTEYHTLPFHRHGMHLLSLSETPNSNLPFQASKPGASEAFWVSASCFRKTKWGILNTLQTGLYKWIELPAQRFRKPQDKYETYPLSEIYLKCYVYVKTDTHIWK